MFVFVSSVSQKLLLSIDEVHGVQLLQSPRQTPIDPNRGARGQQGEQLPRALSRDTIERMRDPRTSRSNRVASDSDPKVRGPMAQTGRWGQYGSIWTPIIPHLKDILGETCHRTSETAVRCPVHFNPPDEIERSYGDRVAERTRPTFQEQTQKG